MFIYLFIYLFIDLLFIYIYVLQQTAKSELSMFGRKVFAPGVHLLANVYSVCDVCPSTVFRWTLETASAIRAEKGGIDNEHQTQLLR